MWSLYSKDLRKWHDHENIFPLCTPPHTHTNGCTHTARRMGHIYMLWLVLWGIRIGRACQMIEFSRDKKTSVLICDDEKGKAARLSSSPWFRLLACPIQQIGTSPLWGEIILMEAGGKMCDCPCAKQMLSQRSCYLSCRQLAANFEELWRCLRGIKVAC